MYSRPYCRKCGAEIPNLIDNGSNIYLCDDCRNEVPRRDGLIDFTKLRSRIIKPRQYVDEKTGKELEDNPPLNKIGFFSKHPQNMWARKGINSERKDRK